MCTHNPAVEMLVRSFHGQLLKPQDVEPLMGHLGSVEHSAFIEITRVHLQRTAEVVGDA